MANREISLTVKAVVICFLLHTTNGYLLQKQFFDEADSITRQDRIPERLDWRNLSGVTEVKNQGQCHACWAFSIIGCVESQVLIKYGKTFDYSEQMLIDCVGPPTGCNNGSLVKNFANLVLSINGVVTEKDYPYENGTTTGECRIKNSKDQLYVIGFVRVVPNEEQIRQHVARVGPLAAAMNSRSMVNYTARGQLIDTPTYEECSPAVDDLDHTVLIVGYDTHEENGVKIPYWIIKNSWGTDWGLGGYYYLLRGKNACGIETDIVYGVIP